MNDALSYLDQFGTTFGKVWTAIGKPSATSPTTPPPAAATGWKQYAAPIGIGLAVLVVVLLVLKKL
jgi:hypothetical protein